MIIYSLDVLLFPIWNQSVVPCPGLTVASCWHVGPLHASRLKTKVIGWLTSLVSFFRASLIAQSVKNPPAMQETSVRFLGQKIHWRRDKLPTSVLLGFPFGSAGKESTCNRGDLGSIPGLGWSPQEGKGYPLQYSGLENSMGPDFHGTSLEIPWHRLSSSIWKQLFHIFCPVYQLFGVLVSLVPLNLPWPETLAFY